MVSFLFWALAGRAVADIREVGSGEPSLLMTASPGGESGDGCPEPVLYHYACWSLVMAAVSGLLRQPRAEVHQDVVHRDARARGERVGVN